MYLLKVTLLIHTGDTADTGHTGRTGQLNGSAAM